MPTVDRIDKALRKLKRPREKGKPVAGEVREWEAAKHVRYEYWLGGLIVWTFGLTRASVSRSRKFYYVPDQMQLSVPQFLDLAECPLTKREYNRLLAEKGKLHIG